MRKFWLTVTGLFLAVAVAGVFAASCGGDTDEENEGTDCKVTCEGKECGTIGDCTCGNCDEGTCEANMCKAEQSDECVAACDGLECGTGGTEGCDCGTCTEGFECGADFMCAEESGLDCEAICDGKECGTVEKCDCGTCADGTECNAATNVCECVPSCVDDGGTAYECGSDGCEGTCGDCAYGTCNAETHACECTPDCDGKDCGADGCGGDCGECLDGFLCQANACVEKGVCTMGEAPVQKVVFMEIGKGGHAGEALDVDGDADTCAPADDCEDGLNNQLSGLLGQLSQFVDADAEIATALLEGSIVLLVDMTDATTDGVEFAMPMYIGALSDEECDWQAAFCDYYVGVDSFDPVSCEPVIMFETTSITDGVLVAGGPDAKFSVTIPVQENLVLSVTADMAQINGDVSGEGEAMIIENGLIGGAVRKDKLMEAVDLIPEDAELPVSKDMIKNLLNMFVIPDVDTDDDGEPDAASIGVKFGSIAGKVIGLEPEDAE